MRPWARSPLFQSSAVLLAMLSLVVMLASQAVSARHVLTAVQSAQQGEVLVCTQYGPMKISLDLPGPAGQPVPKPIQHCAICAGGAAPLMVLAAQVLGLLEPIVQPQMVAVAQVHHRGTAPDRRHAPPHAPPVLS